MLRTYRPNRAANHGLGLSGEVAEAVHVLLTAGFVADRIKKNVYHERDVDIAELRKELGDVLWYVAAVASDYGLSLDEVARENIRKLMMRYPNGFVTGGGVRTEPTCDVGADVPGGGAA